ncbi:S8 family serine peptidase [Flavobacterium salilacus subsp. salilacus]|uniref:S8 family peptidase n=1 Tax=Flavobacterium TaxID=237 RepID=UPI0010755E4B|nr:MULTISPECIES: S8 family peptidase [Flavobacterium]KAF2516899.1 S8 family serine peptidase [Flavobacterium salilacus subsp. salilacus]MBE1615741.1 S8 family peptidase [Flavobacterium sp. SaA2.13]
MKNIFIIICGLFFSLAYSQEKKVYSFYVQLTHYSEAPNFEKEGSLYIYTGKDNKEKEFFSTYQILEFSQAFPASRREDNLSIFLVSSFSKNLISKIVEEFPGTYLWAEDITDIDYELTATYTNDYGGTSPFSNSGIADLTNLDYINAPKAWDYTLGSTDIILGISDAKIDTTDIDLKYKTSFVNPSTSLVDGHGTTVSALAAAQGNNMHGMVGVCSDCEILGTAYGNYNNLLLLAINGVKVINMSWRGGANSFIQSNQNVINEIAEDYGVILVGASGNDNSYAVDSNNNPVYPNGLKYYPASYNHVISVLSVNHRYEFGEETLILDGWGEVSRFVVDMISPSVVTNYQGNGPYGFNSAHTTNEEVDICAPGYRLFRFYPFVSEGLIEYQEGGGTSAAAPHVTGTIGLMLSVNNCLTGNEAEDILQLTSKNLEIIQGNEFWAGKSGSGKMETGDAVEFTYEMKEANGNAVIDGQDFYRFDFNLANINNKLTISNQTFRDKCTADFTARNEIGVLPGSDFKPNEYGYVDLKIDDEINIECDSPRPVLSDERKIQENQTALITEKTKLYPNPNNGTFEITYGNVINNNIQIEVYDIFGKLVYSGTEKAANFNVSILTLSAGVYIVKLSSGDSVETIKFIKQ